ncbi:translation initiation factor IF-2-like [Ischnura elegans]|uniref:translation initiation factor IF-2-like n=1 Tax=Ischnura elegans TaxID=197161 RepID=UPI001ED8B962|nr:translation initiation factor IF-2-like [Ischnura elegans]
MASPNHLFLLVCAGVLLACPSEAQRRGGGRQLSWPSDEQPPSRPGGGRPGGGGSEFWPGAGASTSSPPPPGGEFWPGAGPGGAQGGSTTTTTRRPGGPSGCSCPSTPEYNPVCGTDGVSYGNPGKLNCARVCGRTVSILHYGNCTPADPNAPTTTAAPTSSTTRRRRGRNP